MADLVTCLLFLHLPAIAAANGIHITLDDIEELSKVVPSIARVYPNGPADINQFQEAGGMSVLMGNLLDGGYLHEDVQTVAGQGLRRYTMVPEFKKSSGPLGRLKDLWDHVRNKREIVWKEGPRESNKPEIIATVDAPFAPDGGIKVIRGRLGEGVSKKSSLKEEHRVVTAPARVFDTELGLLEAFQKGELTEDFVAVVRGQAAWQTGMPELHKLITPLTILQNKGLKVGLVTPARLSGASGGIPTVIHLAKQKPNGMPYTGDEEPVNKVRDGDMITINTKTGELLIDVPEEEWAKRLAAKIDSDPQHRGFGRELFAGKRARVSAPQTGCVTLFEPFPDREAA